MTEVHGILTIEYLKRICWSHAFSLDSNNKIVEHTNRKY